MNVSIENIDAVSAILKVKIEKSDYAESLKANLRKLRQKAKLPGFRPGMVPFGLINKMYGKQALIEEINRIVPEQINAYLRDNQIKILGEPLPDETEQQKIDFDVDEDFEFCYDLALSPAIDVQLTKDDSLKVYRVAIDDESVDKQIDSYRKGYGSNILADSVEAGDIVKGTLVELEDNAPKTDGILIEDALLMPAYMKGKMEQKKFIGARCGDSILFNPFKAFKGAEAELASLLHIDKGAVKTMKSDFTFSIKEISRNQAAELNQEFFDRIFGPDAVKNETEFRDRIKASLTAQYASYIDSKAGLDIRNMLIQKAGVAFADGILKRWLLLSNEKATAETVEKEYPQVIDTLKYQLVKAKLVKEHNITVEDNEVETMARRSVIAQYAQYGMYSVPEDTLSDHVNMMLKKQETVDSLVDRILDEKLYALVKTLITIDEQEVTMEEFNKGL